MKYQLSEKDIKEAISCMVGFFHRQVLTASTVPASVDVNRLHHDNLQQRYIDQLEGIHLLFIGNAKINALLDAAKAEIHNTPFQSGDLCRSPAFQSPDVLGQGSN